MTRTINLATFFEKAGADERSGASNQYVAGFRDEDGESWGVVVPLDADDVEPIVMRGIAFSLVIDTTGLIGIEAEGKSDRIAELIASSGKRARSPLDTIVEAALRPDLLAMEDEASADLGELRERLVHAIELVDQAIRNLEQ